MAEPIMRNRGEGEERWFFGGGLHEWMATSAETGGSLFALHDTIDADKTTPLHEHPDADEAVLVLDGAIDVWIDGEERRMESGAFYFTPRGTPHCFRGVAPVTHLFVIQTPGHGDAFYRQASEPAHAGPRHGEVDFAAVGKAASDTGATVILGRPPFAVDAQS